MSETTSVEKIREFTAESGHRVKLNVEGQKLGVRSSTSGLSRKDGVKLYSSLADCYRLFSEKRLPFVSAGALIVKAKQFENGMMAMLEKQLQNGFSDFKGKQFFVEQTALKILEKGIKPTQRSYVNACTTIFGAARLGGMDLELPDGWNKKVEKKLKEFDKHPIKSKPINFYTWDSELEKIFKQTRFLQTPLDTSRDLNGARLVAEILADDQVLADAYLTYLDVSYKLTNAPRFADLRSLFNVSKNAVPNDDFLAIIPPTVSHEEHLLTKIIGPGNPVPKDFCLINEFIKLVRSRLVSLRPRVESGYYDFITWSLAPLIAPDTMVESEHLDLDDSYFAFLEDLLKATLRRTREIYPENLMPPIAPPPPAPFGQLTIRPQLAVEPLPTFYYRRSYSYRFLKSLLTSLFHDEDLKQLHRLTPDGPSDEDILTEVNFMEALFSGAHMSSCKDLGMTPANVAESSLSTFIEWAKHHWDDPDLKRDSRMMIPVYHNPETKKTKALCFFGWREEFISVSFTLPPHVEVFDQNGKPIARKDLWLRPHVVGNTGQTSNQMSFSFETNSFRVYYPVMEELYVKELMSRTEFQKICDEARSFTDIKEACASE